SGTRASASSKPLSWFLGPWMPAPSPWFQSSSALTNRVVGAGPRARPPPRAACCGGGGPCARPPGGSEASEPIGRVKRDPEVDPVAARGKRPRARPGEERPDRRQVRRLPERERVPGLADDQDPAAVESGAGGRPEAVAGQRGQNRAGRSPHDRDRPRPPVG